MQYTAIIFDLFGTLVGDFSRTRYEDVHMRMAGEVHLPYDVFSHAFGQTVSCAGGIGRTGTVVGCYLVRHGLQGEEALVEIMRLRHTMPNGGALSPRREPQRQMVRTWPSGG